MEAVHKKAVKKLGWRIRNYLWSRFFGIVSHRRSKAELDHFIRKLEQQALETAEERQPIYLEAGLKDARLILDAGCGTGEVTKDVCGHTAGTVIAIDDSSVLHNNQ